MELSLPDANNESSVKRLRLATLLGKDVSGSLAQTVFGIGNEPKTSCSGRSGPASEKPLERDLCHDDRE